MLNPSAVSLVSSPPQGSVSGPGDYFTRPQLSNSPASLSWMRPRDDNGRQWTVFGQLLEDDRTPGVRGSETPVPTLKHRTSQQNLLQHPLLARSPSGSNLTPVQENIGARSSSLNQTSNITERKLSNTLLHAPRSRSTSRADANFQRTFAEDSASVTDTLEYPTFGTVITFLSVL